LLGHHPRRPQRQVRHVGEDRDAVSLGQDERHQRPRVEEAALVRVVLDPDQVEARFVGNPCHLQGFL
jgi:hypothetical protein